MRKLFILLVLGGVVITTGCTHNQTTNVESNQGEKITSADENNKAGSLTVEDFFELNQFYKIDTEKSQVKWSGAKVVGGSHTGVLNIQAGRFARTKLDDNIFFVGTIELDMKSIKSDPPIEMLDKHLKSDDFFAVEKFPTSTFTLNSIEKIDTAEYKVTGRLKLKDKEEGIDFPIKITKEGDVLEGKAILTLDRTKWDIRYGSGKFFNDLGDKMIKDEMQLELSIVANKEK